MQEFKINEFITLKLEGVKTNIYVAGEKFRQSRHVLLKWPIDNIINYCYIESIDVITNRINDLLEKNHDFQITISPEEEFWIHCSNIQVWAENNYDTHLLHSPLAYYLLIKLDEVGDPLAKKALNNERKKHSSKYYDNTMYYFKKEYLNFLSEDEITEFHEDLMKNFFETLNYKDIIFQNSKISSQLKFFTKKFPIKSSNIILENIRDHNFNVIHALIKGIEFIDWKLLIEDSKINFFDIVFKSTTALKQIRKKLVEEINNIRFLTDREKQNLIGMIELDEKYYNEYVMDRFDKIYKIVPNSMKKKVIESFNRNKGDAIELIIKTGLIGYFEDEDIRYLPEKVQSRMIKNNLRYFDYQKYEFIIGKEPESKRYEFGGVYERSNYIRLILKKFYESSDKSRQILIKEINNTFSNGTYIMLRELLRAISHKDFKKHQNLILNIDCSNHSVFEGVLKLIKNTEGNWEELEYFHSYLKEELYNLGKKQIKKIKKKILLKLKQGFYEDFLAIIKLRWLEHISDKDFLVLLSNAKIKFIKLLCKLLNLSLGLKDYGLMYERINFCLGLVYKIFLMPDKKYFFDIIDGIALNIRLFIDSIYVIISDELMYINNNVKAQGSELLKYLNKKYFPLNF